MTQAPKYSEVTISFTADEIKTLLSGALENPPLHPKKKSLPNPPKKQKASFFKFLVELLKKLVSYKTYDDVFVRFAFGSWSFESRQPFWAVISIRILSYVYA